MLEPDNRQMVEFMYCSMPVLIHCTGFRPMFQVLGEFLILIPTSICAPVRTLLQRMFMYLFVEGDVVSPKRPPLVRTAGSSIETLGHVGCSSFLPNYRERYFDPSL